MTCRRKQKPGPYEPGSTVEPPPSVSTQAVPKPSQTRSGDRRLNFTATLPIGLAIIGSIRFRPFRTDEVKYPQASDLAMAVVSVQSETSKLIRVDGEIRATLPCVVTDGSGGQYLDFGLVLTAVGWELVLHDQSHPDLDDGTGAGGRARIVKLPSLSAGMMTQPVHETKQEPEAETTLVLA